MTLAAHSIDLGNEDFSHRQIASTVSSRVQQLIILPTEKCNFRCTYCYEDFLIGKMKEPTQLAIERFMERRIPELRSLSLHWFGGEPLMAKGVVLRLSSYAHRLCEQNGVALSGALTTNGYVLNKDLFAELVSYRQRFFQITLDGWGADHDVVRKQANGRGSFDQIWANLNATKEFLEDFTILIRIHVRRDNFGSVEKLIDELARSFGLDHRYQLDFQHLRNLGGEGGKTVERPLSRSELADLEAGFRRRYASAIPRSAKTQLQSEEHGERDANGGLPGEQLYICYAAKPNSLLIRADGRIGKCTVALDDDRNTIGRLNPDGTVTIDDRQLRPWVRGLATLDAKALECPLSGMASAKSTLGSSIPNLT